MAGRFCSKGERKEGRKKGRRRKTKFMTLLASRTKLIRRQKKKGEVGLLFPSCSKKSTLGSGGTDRRRGCHSTLLCSTVQPSLPPFAPPIHSLPRLYSTKGGRRGRGEDREVHFLVGRGSGKPFCSSPLFLPPFHFALNAPLRVQNVYFRQWRKSEREREREKWRLRLRSFPKNHSSLLLLPILSLLPSGGFGIARGKEEEGGFWHPMGWKG